MSKMTVIQLLNKIANGEEVPLEIKCYNKKYRYDSLSNDYEQIGGFSSLFKDLLILNGFDNLPKCLNDEVEIIEEDKNIEKIEMCTGGIMSFDSVENITTELKNKINELIDEINNLKEK